MEPEEVRDTAGEPYNSVSAWSAGLSLKDCGSILAFDHASIEWFNIDGRDGFVLVPKGLKDLHRHWVWTSPAWLCILKDKQNPFKTMVEHQFYIDKLTKAGVYVIGIDAGTTLGSPQGAELFNKVYNYLVNEYNLNRKARMIGQSNGGLIVYGWAFRNPEKVDRILGICPSLDMRSWPGLDRVVGPKCIGDSVYGYVGMTCEELKRCLPELNPIDNLGPLARAGVSILHIHGDADKTVPYEPNSAEAERRYRTLDGQIKVIPVAGLGHNPGPGLYDSRPAVEFLLEGIEIKTP